MALLLVLVSETIGCRVEAFAEQIIVVDSPALDMALPSYLEMARNGREEFTRFHHVSELGFADHGLHCEQGHGQSRRRLVLFCDLMGRSGEGYVFAAEPFVEHGSNRIGVLVAAAAHDTVLLDPDVSSGIVQVDLEDITIAGSRHRLTSYINKRPYVLRVLVVVVIGENVNVTRLDHVGVDNYPCIGGEYADHCDNSISVEELTGDEGGETGGVALDLEPLGPTDLEGRVHAYHNSFEERALEGLEEPAPTHGGIDLGKRESSHDPIAVDVGQQRHAPAHVADALPLFVQGGVGDVAVVLHELLLGKEDAPVVRVA
ncbi:hypothetical protein PG985_010405 [Apiospora marii]|uniref:Uncharacterized protein n=1 Tax=Apiospora marii TaxID=335849 RepID=A0ABR1RZ60_9PEZI